MSADRESYRHVSDLLQIASSRTVVLTALSALWANGLRQRNATRISAARQSVFAILLGAVATKGIKRILRRKRPNEDNDPHQWRLADGPRGSFPSGHATTVGALGTVIGLRRGVGPSTALSAGFAVAICWSSVGADRHWLSDLIGGLVVGAGAGLASQAMERSLTRRRRARSD
jgi:undecaprenyl-diphosphatase